MDRLPRQIITMIVSQAVEDIPYDMIEDCYNRPASSRLDPESLSHYAVISRQWQAAVEPFTFKELCLNSDDISEAESKEILTPERLSYVRKLTVSIEFPLPWKQSPESYPDGVADDVLGHVASEAPNPQPDSFPPEERGYEGMFTSIITSLFRMLHRVPFKKGPSIDVEFVIPVPEEFHWNCIEKSYSMDFELAETAQTESGKRKPLYLDLQLDEGVELPEVPAISSCKFHLESWSLFFAPRAVCLMASKMTRLKKLELLLSDEEKRDEALRIRQRDGFAEGILALPESITYFELQYSLDVPKDHSVQPPSIVPPGQTDNLSEALCKFSQREHLKRFRANGSFDADILWCPDSESSWPGMESYEIGFLPVTPSGKWLAIPGRNASGWGSDEALAFRGPADPEFVHDVVVAGGRAASRMPRLKRMNLNVGAPWRYRFWYSTHTKGKPCLKMSGKKIPRPDEEMLQVWREAAKEHGQELNAEFTEEKNNPRKKEYFH
ncbi:hypothetical protein ACJ41O_006898 [Fusarium nematophilum]